MNTEEKPKSGSKLEFDSNYDLRLVSNLSPALRWVLVLPISLSCCVYGSSSIQFHC